jgi:hypothetical protein
MFERLAARRLQRLARAQRALLILGPRQVGKTTLARLAFSRARYVDLEAPANRDWFAADPRHALDAIDAGTVILDEAQAVPELFAALRGAIDESRPRRKRFVLLGSAQPSLVRGVSESLAGRIGVLELDPLLASEAATGPRPRAWKELWLRGGFPGALRGDFREWWEAYLRLYVERDLPMLGLDTRPLLLRRLLTMLAHAQGGLANASRLGASLGVSHNLVQRYLDILEQTFIIRRLPPFFENVGKRLTKAPKLYIRDTGLLHHLLNIASFKVLDAHPARGASWETFVLEEIVRREKLAHPYSQAYFWRTHAGAEIDLLLDRGNRRVALEIKAGSGRSAYLARGLAAAAADAKAHASWIVDQAQGEQTYRNRVRCRNFAEDLYWLPR